MLSLIRVADPHHFNADPDPEPDPAFHFNADPDPAFHFNAAPDPDPAPHHGDTNLLLPGLHVESSHLNYERVLYGPPRLHFDLLKIQNFDFNADADRTLPTGTVPRQPN